MLVDCGEVTGKACWEGVLGKCAENPPWVRVDVCLTARQITIVAIITAKIVRRIAMDVMTSSLMGSSDCDLIGRSVGGNSVLLGGGGEGGVSSGGTASLSCSRGDEREGEGGAWGMSPGVR